MADGNGVATLSTAEQGTGFAKGRTSKVEQHGWEIRDVPGEMEWIHKAQIKVDHNYQRTNVSNNRVLEIARCWSWVACGVLIIARRPDGSLWAVDGQHRKLAADKRADVQMLPCIVFDTTDVQEEARGYLRANTVRGPIKTAEKFNAMIIASDEPALFVKAMVQESGYRIAKAPCDFGVTCVGQILSSVQIDRRVAKEIWELCVAIHGGQFIRERVFGALFYLERYLHSKFPGETILRGHNRDALIAAGLDNINSAVHRAMVFHGKGGAKICADGVITMLNHKRRTRRIPSCMSSSVEA